jgi:hypothetical protein
MTMYRTMNVQDFGAGFRHQKNDDQAFADAFGMAGAEEQYARGKVIIPPGQYILTKQVKIQACDFHVIAGGGITTQINYFPVYGDGPVFLLKAPGNGILWDCSVEGLTFLSSDTRRSKAAIQAVDCARLVVRDCGIAGKWTGGANGSIGLFLQGREATTIDRWNGGIIDRPIVVGNNPNSTIDCDALVIRDTYMRAGPQYAHIELCSDVVVKSLILEGYHAWGGGRWGLRWEDTQTQEISHKISLNGIHWENEDYGDGHLVSIKSKHGLVQFSARNCSNTGKNGAGAFKLDDVHCASLDSCVVGSPRVEALSAYNVRDLRWNNCFWQSGSKVHLNGMAEISQSGYRVPYAPLSSNGHFRVSIPSDLIG